MRRQCDLNFFLNTKCFDCVAGIQKVKRLPAEMLFLILQVKCQFLIKPMSKMTIFFSNFSPRKFPTEKNGLLRFNNFYGREKIMRSERLVSLNF